MHNTDMKGTECAASPHKGLAIATHCNQATLMYLPSDCMVMSRHVWPVLQVRTGYVYPTKLATCAAPTWGTNLGNTVAERTKSSSFHTFATHDTAKTKMYLHVFLQICLSTGMPAQAHETSILKPNHCCKQSTLQMI
jgi:hypothetical protein